MDAATQATIFWAAKTFPPSNGMNGLHILRVIANNSGEPLSETLSSQYPHHLLHTEAVSCGPASSQPVAHLLTQIEGYLPKENKQLLSITYILPYTSGWIIRSDFLRLRLQVLSDGHLIKCFFEPLQRCDFQQSNDLTPFSTLLATAVGAVSALVDSSFHTEVLEQQLLSRLSYPWLSTQPIPRHTVALVRGRDRYSTGQLFYEAAKFLGVSLVIIDLDGHWLQDDNELNLQIREAFLAVDLHHTPGLVGRIVEAVQNSPVPIQGILTLSDDFLVPVAEAAENLGLPTSPSSAHQTAVDKFLSRSIQGMPGEFTTVTSLSDYHQQVTEGTFRPRYPLIIKPRARGWSSQAVSKVRNADEVAACIEIVCRVYSAGAVIEPYYDGPEIDVDFVLHEGRVLYRQITDELPSPGDTPAGNPADFQETSMMIPSNLPPGEQELIYGTMQNILTQLGFRTGVFHCEARITHSSVEFRPVNGLLELVAKTTPPEGQARCHLIEINARPPGFQAVASTSYAFGVDYFAARILSAIDDKERLEKVCIPFSVPGLPSGAGSWSHLLFLPVLKGGVMAEESRIEHVFEKVPELAAHVVWSVCLWQPGDILPAPESGPCIFATVVVGSTESHRQAIEVAAKLEKVFRGQGQAD